MSGTSRVVELDVREYQHRGEEPFPAIMAAVANLGEPGDTLILINTFEPHPLYRALEKKGFGHSMEQIGPEHFRITFTRDANPA